MKMKTMCYLLVMLIATIGGQACALELTLEEALSMAEQHSHTLKASRAQAEAFDAGLKAAIKERMPTLSASALASYKDEVPQLNIALPTGQSLTRDFGFNETYQVDLRLSLPVYTGGRISGGVQLARSTRDYYEALEKADLDDVILTVRVEYISLVKADRLVQIARAGCKRADVIYGDITSLYQAGAADSVDLLEASLVVSDAQSRLDAALSARRQNQIRLAVVTGLDPSEEIMPISEFSAPDTAGLMFEGVSETKPQLTAAASVVEMSRSTLKLSRSDLFPTLSVFGGYSWGKPNIDPFHDDFNDFFTVGANLNWSFNIAGKSVNSVNKARHQLRAARSQYDGAVEQLDKSARLFMENLMLVFDDYLSAGENQRIAAANYRLAQNRHREGVLSANRLIEIEASLSQAEGRLASTEADFHIVQSQFYYATGSKNLKEGI